MLEVFQERLAFVPGQEGTCLMGVTLLGECFEWAMRRVLNL